MRPFRSFLPQPDPGFFVPDMMDVHFERESFIWCYLVITDGGTDVSLEWGIAELEEGEMSSTLHEEYFEQSDSPIEEALMGEDRRPYDSPYADAEGWQWMMGEGIAPGQPFLIHLARGQSYRSQEGEYDYTPHVQLVRVLPWPESRTLEAWHFHLRQLLNGRANSDSLERRRRQRHFTGECKYSIEYRFTRDASDTLYASAILAEAWFTSDMVRRHIHVTAKMTDYATQDLLWDHLYPAVYAALGIPEELFSTISAHNLSRDLTTVQPHVVGRRLVKA